MPVCYVYMVRCEGGALYTGWTNDLLRRLAAHQSGKGAKYTRAFGAASLAWAEALPDKSAALRREAALKKLPKAQKEALAASFDPARFVLLRPAKPADAAKVLEIFGWYVKNSTASFLYEVPTEAEYRRAIAATRRTLPYILAENALGQPLGYACAHPWRYGCDAYAWDAETTIYLAPAARRLGLGTMLYHGLLAALALALSFLEGLLPALPVPGAKLGLSNIVTMYALTALSLPAALGITAVKAVFALLRGGSAFLMSAAGGLLSTLVMALCLRLFRGKMGDIGIGIAGAVAHNAGQWLMALLLIGPAVLAYAPWLLLMALATGMVTGLTLHLLLPAIGKLRRQL